MCVVFTTEPQCLAHGKCLIICPVNEQDPHLSQLKRFCVMSFLTSSSTFPLLTSVQSHCLLKSPSCSCLRAFALCCPVKRPLSPILSSAGSLPSSRSQLKCHLLTGPPRPHCQTAPLCFLWAVWFFTHQHLNAHAQLLMFIVPLPRRSSPLRYVLSCLCSLLCPRVQARAWHTLDANKHLLKEFASGDQPQYSIIMISCKRTDYSLPNHESPPSVWSGYQHEFTVSGDKAPILSPELGGRVLGS